MNNYYQILGVPATATAQEIKSAFRKIAKANHPDTHPGDHAAVERFKEANEAYLTLGNEQKRSEYDQKLNAVPHRKKARAPRGAAPDFGSMNFGDMFGSMFEDLEKAAQQAKKPQPEHSNNEDKGGNDTSSKMDDPLNVDAIFTKFMGFKP